jgi:hypothetical protein
VVTEQVGNKAWLIVASARTAKGSAASGLRGVVEHDLQDSIFPGFRIAKLQPQVQVIPRSNWNYASSTRAKVLFVGISQEKPDKEMISDFDTAVSKAIRQRLAPTRQCDLEVTVYTSLGTSV